MQKNRIFSGRLSIQQRLPLLICFFLLSAITLYGLTNYYSLRKVSYIVGKDRLNSLSVQLSSMLGQSAQFLIKVAHTSATKEPVVQFLKTGRGEFREGALTELDKQYRDSTWVSMELVDSAGRRVLRSGKSSVNVSINVKDVVSFMHLAPDSAKVGKIYLENRTMYYPIVAAVNDEKRVLGYIISWKRLESSPKAVAQLSQLMGGAGIYIGNVDNSFWTDVIKPVPGLPFKGKLSGQLVQYTDAGTNKMVAKLKMVPYTNWLVAVQFPEKTLLEGMNSYINPVLIGGGVLSIIGIIAAWVMSRNITKPLNKLTRAATAIAQGDYSSSVDIYRKDELGELANAFNVMTTKVYKMHQDLENKVTERTVQLQNVNKELEAFSYSVSHDLRTPLRAVNGYSIMLKEDYEDKLDAEGLRIVNNIINNAKTMGQLIDELLAFSRLGKKELALSNVDMRSLTQSVTDELLDNGTREKYNIGIGPLPASNADRTLIKQVFMNLVGNAIKYSSKRDNPVIEIGAREEGNRVVYFVKDNGVGFDMAYAGKLFGVFQRLHSQEEFEGTGVGLALVKRVIDKHGGEIWAEAEENNGATFYFSLPK